MNGITILQGDCRETLKTLPDNSVHCCVTSPPYFGLRDYGCDGQIGLEDTPDAFVAEMVAVFREVRRVLRDDGTLWLNLGDSYNAYNGGAGPSSSLSRGAQTTQRPELASGFGLKFKGLKPKDLLGIPWRVAFALQADGWYLRQEIIWAKPNPMPESVTDRCTKAHEQIFLLAKSQRYYFDAVAIQEAARYPGDHGFLRGPIEECDSDKVSWRAKTQQQRKINGVDSRTAGAETRNKRSVWTVSTKPYKGAHFATFPPDLIQPCILAGTSEHGACAECGAPWERVVEKVDSGRTQKMPDGFATHSGGHGSFHKDGREKGKTGNPVMLKKTTGWQRTCQCETEQVVPCTVLDPFGGSGTTGEVARNAGCHAILCELNPEYVGLIEKRLEQGSLLV